MPLTEWRCCRAMHGWFVVACPLQRTADGGQRTHGGRCRMPTDRLSAASRIPQEGARAGFSRRRLPLRLESRARPGAARVSGVTDGRPSRPSSACDVSRRGCGRCHPRAPCPEYQAGARQRSFGVPTGGQRRERTRRRHARTVRRIAMTRRAWQHQVSRKRSGENGRRGRPEDRRQDACREENRRGAGRQRALEGRLPSRHPCHRLERRAGDDRLQGCAIRRGERGASRPNVCGVWSGGRRYAPLASDTQVRGARSCGPCGTERGPRHQTSPTGVPARSKECCRRTLRRFVT